MAEGERKSRVRIKAPVYISSTSSCSDTSTGRTGTCGLNPTHGIHIVHTRHDAQLGIHDSGCTRLGTHATTGARACRFRGVCAPHVWQNPSWERHKHDEASSTPVFACHIMRQICLGDGEDVVHSIRAARLLRANFTVPVSLTTDCVHLRNHKSTKRGASLQRHDTDYRLGLRT